MSEKKSIKDSKSFQFRQIKDETDKNFADLLEARINDRGIDDSIREMYGSEVDGEGKRTGQKPPVIERRKVDPWQRISITFLVLLFVLALTSWLMFIIFNAGSRINTNDVTFFMVGPPAVVVGEEAIYELRYKNLSGFNLHDVEVTLDYPQNFIILDTVPARVEPEASGLNIASWLIDDISVKRSGRIEIKAKIIAPVDSEHNLFATLKYRPENFSSTFSVDAVAQTAVSSTGVNLNIDSPSFFNVDEESEISIAYVKEKENYLGDFYVKLVHGEDFSLSKSVEAEIHIQDIAEQKNSVSFKGKYGKKPSLDDQLKLVFFVRDEAGTSSTDTPPITDSATDAFAEKKFEYIFAEYDLDTIVAEGAMQLSATINRSQGGQALSLGDELNYVIHFKNNSEANLKNVIIILAIDSKLIDWNSLAKSQGAERRSNSLIWTKTQVSSLADIGPDKEDSFGFSIKLKSLDQVKDIPTADFKVVSSLDYSIDGKIKSASEPVVKITNPINSDTALKSEIRYFDVNDVAVGEGPLPPQVGAKTVYRVFWTVTNTRHDLKDVTIKATLPKNISWENNFGKSIGTLTYNADSKEVLWLISDLDAISEPAVVDFGISLNPSEDQKNQVASLLTETVLNARDVETNSFISIETKAKTTNLDDDAVGKGYGKIE